jgi:ornithine carbamoyltransferase
MLPMHLLELSTLSEEQVLEIFELTMRLKENQNSHILRGDVHIIFP